MTSVINGNDVDELLAFKSAVENDRSEASRWPVLTARWEGGSRSRIEFGDVVTYMGGEDELNAMQALLAALAACDVDLVVMHAAFLGITIESLTVEAKGHFNVAAYLGIEGDPGPGYDHISYQVRLRAPGITDEQVDLLRRRCELSSPVGDTLTRSVPLELDIELE